MNKFYQKIKNNYEAMAVFLFLVIIIFSFLFCTGTLSSGYHFIDDHGIISIENNLEKGSFLKTVINYSKDDLNIRFRPFYYFYYIYVVKVFGLNFFAMSVFYGFLATFSFSFFYFGARKLGNNILNSLIFVLLTFMGPQAAIWWRLGTNETIGMFFLGLAFLFMAKCNKKEKYKFNNISFIIFLVVASLCKESFIIIIPAFVIFKIWNEKNVFKIKLKESIRNNYLIMIPVVIMFIELVIIKFVVGTNKIGYAGITSSGEEFVNGVKNILFNPLSLSLWFRFIGYMSLLYLILFIFLRKRGGALSESVKNLFVYFCFALFLILPNIFMHAKSGMTERYLLPTTLGLAFFILGILHNTKQIFFKGLMLIFISNFIFTSFNVAKLNAAIFSKEGAGANVLLDSTKNNIKKESNILLVVDPVGRFEVSYSVKTYLSYYGFNNFYAYPILRDYKTNFEIGLRDQWMKWFEGRSLKDIEGVPDVIIIFDKENVDKFFKESGVSINYYREGLMGAYPYQVYIKNK